MTIREFADSIGVQYQTVWRMMERRDMLPPHTRGNTIELRSEDVFKLLCFIRFDPVEDKTETTRKAFRYALSNHSNMQG